MNFIFKTLGYVFSFLAIIAMGMLMMIVASILYGVLFGSVK